MAKSKKKIPEYGTVILNGVKYFRTRITDQDGKSIALYGKTCEELYDKVEEAKQQIEDDTFRQASPTVAEYCEKWLMMQSANVRATTLTDYRSKVKRHIVGHGIVAVGITVRIELLDSDL